MTKFQAAPRHILITHVYSGDNKGDAALVSVALAELRGRFPGAAFTVSQLEKPNGTFEGARVVPSFMHFVLYKPYNPLLKLTYALLMVAWTVLWAWIYSHSGRHLWLPASWRVVARAYARADLVVPVGGGYLRSRRGLRHCCNIPLLLHPLVVGRILGKPTMLYSQSIGPFVRRYEGWLVALVLRGTQLVCVREDISVHLLRQLGVARNVVRTVDAGFLFTGERIMPANDLRARFKLAPSHLLVGVTVRTWLAGAAQAQYEQSVAAALDTFLTRHPEAFVVFIPQVTAARGDDDRVASHRVLGNMQHKQRAALIAEAPHHRRVKAMYDQLDLLLGTRFHSVIFALTSHVPVIAIEYEHKTSGIMHDIGLDEWVMKIQDVRQANLAPLLERLWQNRIMYRQALRVVMPNYLTRARRTSLLMAAVWASSEGDSSAYKTATLWPEELT